MIRVGDRLKVPPHLASKERRRCGKMNEMELLTLGEDDGDHLCHRRGWLHRL